MSFLEDIKNVQSRKETENGALALKTSGDYLVDLVGLAGAFRTRSPEELINLFYKALAEDHLLATKYVYYLRDIREGLGERKAGKVLLYTLAKDYPKTFVANLDTMIDIGRYDDAVDILCALKAKGIENESTDALEVLIRQKFYDDLSLYKQGKPISLLAKWLPSINTSSSETRAKALVIRDVLRLDNSTYRKILSQLRKHLNIVERNISEGTYDEINYEAVPSKAMQKYKNVFSVQDTNRFNQYKEDVKAGTKKINAQTLFPYEIVRDAWKGKDEEVLELAWKALPNYVAEDKNFLVMADVSGSMSIMNGLPLNTSVGLALYFAERNKGAFANHFMTFSGSPRLVEIKGNTLKEKIAYIVGSDREWAMNTNLSKGFNLILKTAIENHTPQEEFPTSLIVISDMEIDYATNGTQDKIFTDLMRERFEKAGYKLPNLVYWNVCARNNTFHAKATDSNVQLISGSSPTIFKSLCEGVEITPRQFVEQLLNVPRYEKIVFIPNN